MRVRVVPLGRVRARLGVAGGGVCVRLGLAGDVRSAAARGIGLAVGAGCLIAEVVGGVRLDFGFGSFRSDRFGEGVS